MGPLWTNSPATIRALQHPHDPAPHALGNQTPARVAATRIVSSDLASNVLPDESVALIILMPDLEPSPISKPGGGTEP
jgi:hypothetical protein